MADATKTKVEIVLAADVAEGTRPAEEEDSEDSRSPKMGLWYWVTGENYEGEKRRWFGCVTHVGSNYAEICYPGGSTERIHEDEFYERCERVPNPSAVIDAQVSERQIEVRALMEEVKAITRRLAVSVAGPALPAASETKALALRGSGEDLGKYKKALSKAKEKELPELFAKIKKANESLGTWLSASLIPLRAQAKAMEPAIAAIEERIFSVELYAGLSEEVVEIKGGQAAPASEKVHLMQRRYYMDEECLARYETGGMEFKNVGEFHKWLARPENMERILPFPRCIASFRVRRHDKERTWDGSYSAYFQIKDEREADKFTFLYVKNGEQLHCLATSIEFEEKLFPDMDHALLRDDGRGKLYAEVWSSGTVKNVISEQEYLSRLEEDEKKDDKFFWRTRDYHPFERGDIYYDDINKHIQSELKKHNRLVLVLQGLLDRSPVLHPHPPWAIWAPEGFEQALALVYDDSRTLTTGDKPDFEAYRKKLNESLAEGSVTVGQEDYWEECEAEKENERRDRDYRWKGEHRPKRYRPSGNPGPGTLARVARFSLKKKACTFEWERERQSARWDGWGNDMGETVRCVLSAPFERLLNVSAYKPGDFKVFFDDPRTRAEYLEWAPLLLEAEEYHAGNRKVSDAPTPAKKTKTAEGAYKYKMKKARQAFHHKAVRLRRDLQTVGGTTYSKGSLWRVVAWSGGKFSIAGIDEIGRRTVDDSRYVREVGMEALEIDDSIPPESKEQR